MSSTSLENIELVYLRNEDYLHLKEAMLEAYRDMPGGWQKEQIKPLISLFRAGQVAIKLNGELTVVPESNNIYYEKPRKATADNSAMPLIADGELDLLRELHHIGSVCNLRDRRKGVYELSRAKKNF